MAKALNCSAEHGFVVRIIVCGVYSRECGSCDFGLFGFAVLVFGGDVGLVRR